MTTSRRRRAPKQRICAFCSHGIAEARPVFLVATVAGEIQGPYHAGCAAKLAMVHKGTAVQAKTLGGQLYGQLPLAREETLPW
jgi:hypothetical protein